MTDLILASTSPYRRELMQRLQIPFRAIAPGVDEAPLKAAGGSPVEVAANLARAKALAVAALHPEAFVIGSDQIAAIDGQMLDKPGTLARAREQLQRLQGREHQLVTAVAIAHPGGVANFVDVARLCMRSLTSAEIDRYLAAEPALDCAGSYKLEGLGISLFAGISAEDHTAIVGLPLLHLAAELRQLGLLLP